MKKFLIGCLVILVIGGALLAGGAYLAYRTLSPVVEDARNYLQQLSRLGDLDRQVKNQSTFAPPGNGELTPAQVERFVRVQERVRSSLGKRFAEIDAEYERLKADAKETRQLSIGELLAALSNVANVFVQAKQFQVDALNQENFSQAEYSWVRDRVYQAAGVEATRVVDWQKLRDAVRQGTGSANLPDPPKLPDAPARNRELVKPHLAKMDEWLPLAFFGL